MIRNILVLMAFLSTSAFAGITEYTYPQIDNAYIDTCNFSGSGQVCGRTAAWTAAHAYCDYKTGGDAVNFRSMKKENWTYVKKFSLNTREFEWHTSAWQYIFEMIMCTD